MARGYHKRDKKVQKMTRDGLVEQNLATGEEQRISQRGQDFNLRRAQPESTPVRPASRTASKSSGRSRSNSAWPLPTQEEAAPQDAAHSPNNTVVVPYDNTHEHPHLTEYHDSEAPAHQAPGAFPLPDKYSEDTVHNSTISHNTRGDAVPHSGPYHLGHQAPQNSATGRLLYDTSQPGRPLSERTSQKGTAYHRRLIASTSVPRQGQSDRAPASETQPTPGSPPPPRSRLEFTRDEQPPNSTDALPPNRKLEKAKRKAERSAEKLEEARGKIPTKHKVLYGKVFNEETGEIKRQLRFEETPKTQGEHLKGPLPMRPVKFAASSTLIYAHRKIHEVEDENVAVKVAHRGERMAEETLRTASRRRKTRHYRQVQKLQKTARKCAVEHSYQKALHNNPKLKSNVFSRMMQKRKIKRQYAKAARLSSQGASGIVKKTVVTIGRAPGFIVRAIVGNPKVLALLVALILVFSIIAGAVASCSSVMGGFQTILASSYLAEDEDIDDASIAYTEWETDLRIEIREAEINHPDYDEYRFETGEIGHRPLMLMAFLTAVFQDFTFAEIEPILREIFDEQYQLEFISEVEIRTRTVTGIDPDTGEEYEDEEEYYWYILYVILTSQSFYDVIAPRMDPNQREIFDVLMETKGNRQYICSPFDFDWLSFVSSLYGWRISPITGDREFHTGLDIAVPQGTEILAGLDGTVTFAGDNGDYGLFVAIECERGVIARYAHCSEILVSAGQQVVRGDVIALVGSTGNSTGPHLHIEVIVNGRFLNPIFFAMTSP